MAKERTQRKLAAILAADVVGYSRLMEIDETGTLTALNSLRAELFDPATERFGGRIFKTTGDGALVEFPSVVDAVQCAADIQRVLTEQNAAVPDDQRIDLRIGISLGDVIVEGDDLYGNGVNIAARLEAMADRGGICIAGNVHEQVRTLADIGFEDLGDQQVKNIERPVRAYKILLDGPGNSETGAPSRQKWLAWRRWPAVAAVLLIAGSVGLWTLYQNKMSLVASVDPRNLSIVVLPFDNLSGDPKQDYFADGITEDLITDLSRIRDAFVIARGTTFTYKRKKVDPKTVANDLNVRYVLEGSVRRSGDQVRVNAQLIDAKTGAHVWSDRFDRELKDVFSLQNDITGRLAAVLKFELLESESCRLQKGPPANLEAEDYALRGWAHMATNRHSKENTLVGKRLLEQALQRDPDSGLAWIGMARVYMIAATSRWGITKTRKEALELLLQASQRAVELNPKNSDSYYYLSFAYRFNQQTDKAITACETGIEINPNDDQAYTCLGIALVTAGRFAEALPSFRQAIKLNPRTPQPSPRYFFLGLAHLGVGEYEKAVAVTKKGIGANPKFPPQYYVLASALGWLDRKDEARPILAEFNRIDKGRRDTIAKMRNRYSYMRNFDHVYEGLRRAGMPETDTPKAPRLSIVVLPFENLSGDPKQDYFADGITEDLITDLSRIRGMFVIARGTSFTYKGKPVAAKNIAKELNVHYVLEGSVRRSGDQVRVNAQLIDGETGSHIWSDRFDREFKNVFALQNDVTGRIAGILKGELLQAESHRLQSGPPANLDAWSTALQGFVRARENPRSIEAYRETKGILERAIALDPALAMAWTGLARLYYVASTRGYPGIDRIEARKWYIETAEKAVALGPHNSDAQTELGQAYRLNRQPRKALASCSRAVRLNANNDDAQFCTGQAHLALGETKKALPYFKKALRLNPRHIVFARKLFLAEAHIFLGQYEKAISNANEGLADFRKHGSLNMSLISALALAGKNNQAQEALSRFLSYKSSGRWNTLAKAKSRFSHVSPHYEKLLEGLRLAGMPER